MELHLALVVIVFVASVYKLFTKCTETKTKENTISRKLQFDPTVYVLYFDKNKIINTTEEFYKEKY